MKIAFVGKGGSGKTTIAALLCRFLASRGEHVLAIDSDINQHLAQSIGLSEDDINALPLLGAETERLQKYIKGNNARIVEHHDIIRTTPPGNGSRVLTLSDPFLEDFCYTNNNLSYIRVGQPPTEQFGQQCYHVNMSAASILLNHLIDRKNEYVIVDLTAGIDAIVSGMFVSYDVIVAVVEPTRKSVEVYNDVIRYAAEVGHCGHVLLVANKVQSEADLDFIKKTTNSIPLAVFGFSPYIKAMEQGTLKPFDDVEGATKIALDNLKTSIDSQHQDRARLYSGLVYFHERKAVIRSDGQRLRDQIDPDFDIVGAAKNILK